jgi:hypothetical protein
MGLPVRPSDLSLRPDPQRGAEGVRAWTAPKLDRGLIWQQAYARLTGRVPDVQHH